ncbi:hypothetical protein SAY86_025134 [Trapa natans]|uniref:Sister chromatid cohesion 1 protein 1 n=1 Tax=Trapa natans TaxID=22666 RepID=A0AAN7M7U2_TRANT|nr:hypothetical protein SAY86_025134 [Trapa natans]
MFYSHQLLARKASLGQIWMAATMHAKINRRKLNKLNIIKICEEILNPSIPMALRLSGILMGINSLFYSDPWDHLLALYSNIQVEINEAWKVKSTPQRKTLSKGKLHAKKDVAKCQGVQEDVEGIERIRNYSDANATFRVQQTATAYFAMRLDSVDEECTNQNLGEEVHSQHLHQADAANITLCDRFDLFQTDRDLFNHFERFDIEEDDTQTNFGHTSIPPLVPSPPQFPQPPIDEINDQHQEHQTCQPTDECREDEERQAPAKNRAKKFAKNRARKLPTFVMDNEQIIIPGYIYQSWLQDTSSIVSRRGRKKKRPNVMSTMKIAQLMELPPTVLSCGLIGPGGEIHYPRPLLELWRRSSQPLHHSPSGRNSASPPPVKSSSSAEERAAYQDLTAFPFEDFQTGARSMFNDHSIEKQRAFVKTNGMPSKIILEGLRTEGINNNSTQLPDPHLLVTPRNSEIRSVPSSGSAHGFLSTSSEVNSGRSNRKRPRSSSINSSGGLEPVAEEGSWLNMDPNFRLSRLSEVGTTPDQELLVETAPTQTQNPIASPILDKLTDTIRTQMKAHFDSPRAPPSESLSHLASGLSRKGAAMLFYHTCVLATQDILKVQQEIPYGDILISKGSRM